MVGFHQRMRLPELMDDPALEARAHSDALRGLARSVRLLDVACGSGDVTLALIRKARRDGVEFTVTGCDISPVAIEAARHRAGQAGLQATFVQANALTDELPGVFDVVLASLFLHHLSRDDSVTLLRAMGAAARRLVVIDDLIRGAAGYLLAATAPRLLTRSPVVHVDARLSVRSAFKPEEARVLAETAGLVEIEVRRHWPARFLLTTRGAA